MVVVVPAPLVATEATDMTLVEFLLARIAEDEAAARIAQFNNGRWTHTFTFGMETAVTRGYGPDVVKGYGSLNADDHAHIARHDPARVLAECAAKRRILEIAVGPWDDATINRAVDLNQRGSTVMGEDGEEEEVAEWTTTRLLRALAAVYADHADYQPEWKP